MNKDGNDELSCAEPVPTYTRHRWGYTYFIRRGDFIKIGHSANPESRAMDLQIGFPDELEILAKIHNSILTEEAAHSKFHHLRTRGEWFRADDELLNFIHEISPIAERMTRQRMLKDMAHLVEHGEPEFKETRVFYLRKMLKGFNELKTVTHPR